MTLTLVGVVAAAALANRARTPRGQIVMPAGMTPQPGATPEPVAATQLVVSESPSASVVAGVTTDPPKLFVPHSIAAPKPGRPAVLRGLIDHVESVTVNGSGVVVEPGAFTAEINDDAAGVKVVAVGLDGSSIEVDVPFGPDRVVADPAHETVAVHVALDDLRNPARWLPILEMAANGHINAVQIDVKDETGQVGYASAVPLAASIGAVDPTYDPATLIQQLHDLDVKVVGRVVCFLDPRFGAWAWASSRPDLVVQDSTGAALANGYGAAAFVNVAQPEVRQYLWDLTSEAIALGFDEILYDYVRRPEGNAVGMRFPGLTTSPTVAVARFVRDSAAIIEPTDARFGVSVFGISASRPDEIGQDISLIAPHVDFLAPMLYPALWGDGEYGVERPWKTPGLIVDRALTDFHHVTAGSGAEIVPWLQDFDAGRFKYGEAQVREQIDAARWQGTNGYLIWNPNSVYDAAALDRVFPRTPPVPEGGVAVADG